MLLVLPITLLRYYNIWGCMRSTGTLQFRWLKGYIYSSCYYHNHIGSINLTHSYHISVAVCLICWLQYNLWLIADTFRENWNFVLSIIAQFISADSPIRFGLQIVFIYSYITLSHCHLCVHLSEDIGLILSGMWVIVCIFSQLSTIQYVGLCVFSLPIFLVMILII